MINSAGIAGLMPWSKTIRWTTGSKFLMSASAVVLTCAKSGIARHQIARLWVYRYDRFNRRKRRQPQCQRLFCIESRCDRLNQISWKRMRQAGYSGELQYPSGGFTNASLTGFYAGCSHWLQTCSIHETCNFSTVGCSARAAALNLLSTQKFGFCNA